MTGAVFSFIFGAGLALNGGGFVAFSSSSFFCLSSLAAFNFLAMASPGSSNDALVVGLVDLTACGGMKACFAFPPSSSLFDRSSFAAFNFAATASPGN